jgi:hypothetical protein
VGKWREEEGIGKGRDCGGRGSRGEVTALDLMEVRFMWANVKE